MEFVLRTFMNCPCQLQNGLRGSEFVEIVASHDIKPDPEIPGSLNISLVKADCPEESNKVVDSDNHASYHFTREVETVNASAALRTDIVAYPNPVCSREMIYLESSIELYQIEVFDLRSQQIDLIELNPESKISSNLYGFPCNLGSGIYVLKCVGHEEIVYRRIVVE